MDEYEVAKCMKDIMLYLRDGSYNGEIELSDLKIKHSYPQNVLVAAAKVLLESHYVLGTKNEGNNDTSYLLSGLTAKGQKYLKG